MCRGDVFYSTWPLSHPCTQDCVQAAAHCQRLGDLQATRGPECRALLSPASDRSLVWARTLLQETFPSFATLHTPRHVHTRTRVHTPACTPTPLQDKGKISLARNNAAMRLSPGRHNISITRHRRRRELPKPRAPLLHRLALNIEELARWLFLPRFRRPRNAASSGSSFHQNSLGFVSLRPGLCIFLLQKCLPFVSGWQAWQ